LLRCLTKVEVAAYSSEKGVRAVHVLARLVSSTRCSVPQQRHRSLYPGGASRGDTPCPRT
ncbi:MAG: hypothetical protein ACK559_20075, partial [bacterium]